VPVFERQFDIRELNFGSSFYRFAGFRKTRKNRKNKKKAFPLLYFFLFSFVFSYFGEPPKA